MIDLHTHTDASDGTYSPERLIAAAIETGLEALGISDHDTFEGYDRALPAARAAGLDLVCGIELSTKLRRARGRGKTVHMLGYFLNGGPPPEFRGWLGGIQRARRDRNKRLAARLQSLGMAVTLEEVEQRGRSLAGRPHFAQLMLDKGYVTTLQEAFDLYLAENAKAYVEREEPSLEEGLRRILEAGGLPAAAHPVRLGRHATFEKLIAAMKEAGMLGLEVYHSDHGPREVEEFGALARHYGLAVTGGTDFHGDTKPGVALGTGRGNVHIPRRVLDELRAFVLRSDSSVRRAS